MRLWFWPPHALVAEKVLRLIKSVDIKSCERDDV